MVNIIFSSYIRHFHFDHTFVKTNNRSVIIDKIFPQIYHVYNLQISCVDKVRKDKKKTTKNNNKTTHFILKANYRGLFHGS
jgi:hypothetical protein